MLVLYRWLSICRHLYLNAFMDDGDPFQYQRVVFKTWLGMRMREYTQAQISLCVCIYALHT
jgi:hypothetical protein